MAQLRSPGVIIPLTIYLYPSPIVRSACKNPFADQATLSTALLGVWISVVLVRVFGCVIEASGISECVAPSVPFVSQLMAGW